MAPVPGGRLTASGNDQADQRWERWLVGLGLVGTLAALAALDLWWTVITGGLR